MSAADNLYHYRARVERVIDGDTFVALIDTGFSCFTRRTVRILGMNAPEPHGVTKSAGLEATRKLSIFLSASCVGGPAICSDIILRTEKPDSFGRLLAEVWTTDGKNVAEMMLATGHAERRAK